MAARSPRGRELGARCVEAVTRPGQGLGLYRAKIGRSFDAGGCQVLKYF